VSVFGIGYFGPHPVPRPNPSPIASLLAQNATPVAPTAVATASPPEPIRDTTNPLDGLLHLTPAANQMKQSWLPGQVSSQSMAVVGGRLFYVVDGDRIQATDLGSDNIRQTLVTVPQCQGINQLAAAGHELAYVVASPGGSASQVAGCGSGTTVDWSVWLLDLNGGRPRQVANGSREASSIYEAEFPTHVAITPSAYAFDRPPSSAAAGLGEAVEVHSIDGHLLWTSKTARPVAEVMLGGGTLAMLTDVVTHADGWLDLWRSDAANPVPHRVDGPASSASISQDGAYLTWDLPPVVVRPAFLPQPVVGIEKLDPGTIDFPTTLTRSDQPVARHAAVSSTPRGLMMAWLATSPAGDVYPAFRYVAGGVGAILPSLQQPFWLNIDGGTLTWVAESSDGWSKEAFAIDLSGLAIR